MPLGLQRFIIDEPEAIDAYLSEQDAQRALEDCLRDEPERRGLLRVEEERERVME